MIFDHKLLGGLVNPAQAWWNNHGDNAFHEVGDGMWRVSFTPLTPGKVIVQAHLKHRMGEGNPHSRLYCKARVVLVAPVYKNDFCLYSEMMFEGAPGYGDQVRFLDAPITPFIVADILESGVGVTHTFAVEYLAGDGIQGQVGYGSPFVIFG